MLPAPRDSLGGAQCLVGGRIRFMTENSSELLTNQCCFVREQAAIHSKYKFYARGPYPLRQAAVNAKNTFTRPIMGLNQLRMVLEQPTCWMATPRCVGHELE